MGGQFGSIGEHCQHIVSGNPVLSGNRFDRVPETTGFPPLIAGSTMMRLAISGISGPSSRTDADRKLRLGAANALLVCGSPNPRPGTKTALGWQLWCVVSSQMSVAPIRSRDAKRNQGSYRPKFISRTSAPLTVAHCESQLSQ